LSAGQAAQAIAARSDSFGISTYPPGGLGLAVPEQGMDREEVTIPRVTPHREPVPKRVRRAANPEHSRDALADIRGDTCPSIWQGNAYPDGSDKQRLHLIVQRDQPLPDPLQ
jgi:hypothetical protein